MEILPTILTEAGIEPPANLVLDGFDMMPVLCNQSPSPRQMMFWQRRDDKAARIQQWKWVESKRGNGLFDLSKDPGETEDLSITRPDKLKELKDAFADWKRTLDAAEPRGPFQDY